MYAREKLLRHLPSCNQVLKWAHSFSGLFVCLSFLFLGFWGLPSRRAEWWADGWARHRRCTKYKITARAHGQCVYKATCMQVAPRQCTNACMNARILLLTRPPTIQPHKDFEYSRLLLWDK